MTCSNFELKCGSTIASLARAAGVTGMMQLLLDMSSLW